MNTLVSFFPLLQEGGPGGGAAQLPFMLIMMGAIIAVFYFMLIRPQRKKQKELQSMIESLKKGDRIVTIGGIRGSVFNVTDKTVVVKVDDNTKIEFSKDAIAGVVNKGSEDTATPESKS